MVTARRLPFGANHGAMRRAVSLGAQTLLNGVVGLFFARALAGSLGVSSEKDAFDVAYAVPFVVMGTLGLTWMQGVITSRLAHSRNDPELSQAFFSWCLLWASGISLTGAALCAALASHLARFLAPGLPDDDAITLTSLLLVIAPLVVTFSISALCSAALLAYEKAISLELTQLLSRSIAVIAIMIGVVQDARHIAVALVIGSLLGMVVSIKFVLDHTNLRFNVQISNRKIRQLKQTSMRQGWGFLIAAMLAQITQIVSMRVCSQEPGTIAMLGYAGVVGLSLGQIIGKSISQATAYQFSGRNSEVSVARLSITAMMGAGAVGAIAYLAMPYLVRDLLYRGQFDPAEMNAIVQGSQIMLINVPFQVVLWTTLQPLLVHRMTLVAPALFIGSSCIQILLISPLFRNYGMLGIIYAQLTATAVQATISLALAANLRRLKP